MLDEITTLMQKMIQNRCVNPPGNEMKNILTVKEYLDSYGVTSEIYESAPDRGNLLAEIPGSTDHPSLMLGPSHVDVVPVDSESTWTVPPFEGVVKDGCVWGRGSLDMLYIVACQTVVFSKLHQEGFKPKGDFKLLIVADEEASGTLGAGWMVENHPERVKVDYAITEQGGEPIDENRVAYWYGEKGLNWTRVRFRGSESHGSAPYGSDNAAVKMAEGIVRISQHQPARDMSIIKPLVEMLSMGGGTRRMVTSEKLLSSVLKQVRKSNPGMAAYLHAISQTTFSPNVCSSGTKINVVPGSAILDIDIRTLPGHNEDYVREEILKALGDLAEDVELEKIPIEEGGDYWPGTTSMIDSPLVEVMSKTVKNLRGQDYELVPMFSPGATDCRWFRNAFGTHAYGFALHDDLLDMSTLLKLFHGDDERVSLGTIDLTSKAYLQIVQDFLG